MKASVLINKFEEIGIDTIAGVPDSTLRTFCDYLNEHKGNYKHYVTANEGAAVGLAIGTYLGSGKPACIYMQNSGEGNIINPLASLANSEVYSIPMLFLIGWRGEPGVHDEPQHVFQGKITCSLLELMKVPYDIIDSDTSDEELDKIIERAKKQLDDSLQYAIVVKKGTFVSECCYEWDNKYEMNREKALGEILRMAPRDAAIISTTGKISRELYEQSDACYGNHDNVFMTVGGMGHASMIAFGVAVNQPGKRVICIDGDGAMLMHMGSSAFIASNAPTNYVHIVINNLAHESVGGMPTGCQAVNFSMVAQSLGYKSCIRITTYQELKSIGALVESGEGPVFIEVMVSLGARDDLGRPKESPKQNKESFSKFVMN